MLNSAAVVFDRERARRAHLPAAHFSLWIAQHTAQMLPTQPNTLLPPRYAHSSTRYGFPPRPSRQNWTSKSFPHCCD